MELSNDKTLFRKKITVASYECDLSNRMKLSFLLKQIEECSGNHYAAIGNDYYELIKRDQIFILSKIFMTIDHTPTGGEEFYIETWENEYKGVYCVRNFVCKNIKTDEIFIRCKTYWVIVSVKEHKITRPKDSHFEIHAMNNEIEVNEYKWIKPYNAKSLKKVGEYPVLYKDIDRYNHLNNTVYADIATSYIPVDFAEEYVSEFSIFFKHECVLGDSLEIFIDKSDKNEFFVQGNKNPDKENAVSFNCYIKTKKAQN